MKDIEQLLSMSIELRSIQLTDMAPGTLRLDELERVVAADLAVLYGTTDGQARLDAALFIGANGQDHADYQSVLVRTDKDAAAEAAAALLDEQTKVARKDDRKGGEFSEMTDARRSALLLAGLKAVSKGEGAFVTPDEVIVYRPGIVPPALNQLYDGSGDQDCIEAVLELVSLGTLRDEALCLFRDKGQSPLWVLADPAQDCEDLSVANSFILFQQDGVPRAVSPDPSVLERESAALREQLGKVDGMVAALLTYAVTGEAPSKFWLDAFGREREKLWQLSGALDGLVPIENKPSVVRGEQTYYGTIIVSDEQGMTLLRALGVGVAGYDVDTQSCRASVSESALNALKPFHGEFSWTLFPLPCELEKALLSRDGVDGVPPEYLEPCQEFLLYTVAVSQDGVSPDTALQFSHKELIFEKLRMVAAALRAARTPESAQEKTTATPDQSASPL